MIQLINFYKLLLIQIAPEQKKYQKTLKESNTTFIPSIVTYFICSELEMLNFLNKYKKYISLGKCYHITLLR